MTATSPRRQRPSWHQARLRRRSRRSGGWDRDAHGSPEGVGRVERTAVGGDERRGMGRCGRLRRGGRLGRRPGKRARPRGRLGRWTWCADGRRSRRREGHGHSEGVAAPRELVVLGGERDPADLIRAGLEGWQVHDLDTSSVGVVPAARDRRTGRVADLDRGPVRGDVLAEAGDQSGWEVGHGVRPGRGRRELGVGVRDRE